MKQLKIVACLALGVVVFLLVLAGADGYIVEFNRSAWLKVVLNVLLLFYRLLLEGPFLLITSSQEKKKNKGVYALTL